MIEICDIHKSFGTNKVLNGISFSLDSGTVYGLIGKNGAGKTTLLNIIAGLSRADIGCITTSPDSKICFLPDVPSFFDHLTAAEYIDFLMQGKCDSDKRNAILDTVHLDANVKCKTMSRGMKQRLGIASVLVNDPQIILLDEPTSALDPAGRHELAEILTTLKNNGKSIILSTHILSDMENICDNVGFLQGGVIKRELRPSDVSSDTVELSVMFEQPIDVSSVIVNGWKISTVNQNTLEFRCVGGTENVISMQQALLSQLSSINNKIVDIHTLKASLDAIFDEVCL